MGNAATNTATLTFTFSGQSTARMWEIKVSQITCTDLSRYDDDSMKHFMFS